MKKLIVSLSFLFVFILACFAADLTGNWKGVVKTPDGSDLEIVCHLKAEGDKLTGKVEAVSLGELPIIDGRVEGKDVNFKLKLGNTLIENKGVVYTDSIVITTEVQGNTFQNTFKRVGANTSLVSK